jgi:5-methylcytosine-specific restriction endonuclease McrA
MLYLDLFSDNIDAKIDCSKCNEEPSMEAKTYFLLPHGRPRIAEFTKTALV